MTPHHYDSTDIGDIEALELPLDELSGPAKRLSPARRAALIDAALDAALTDRPARRIEARWRIALVAIVMAGAVTAAAAGVYRMSIPEPEIPAKRGLSGDNAAEPTTALDIDAGDDEAVEPPVEDAPLPGPRTQREATRERSTPAKRKAREPRAPADLLQAANEQRRARQWSRADALYRRVVREHRGTRAAYVARIASASIQLEHMGNPARALRLYRSTLRQDPRGPLAEEARFGVAEALRALGNTAGERRALETFLSRHSDSPLAARVRARLAALGAAP